jgi:hypothetical protein
VTSSGLGGRDREGVIAPHGIMGLGFWKLEVVEDKRKLRNSRSPVTNVW